MAATASPPPPEPAVRIVANFQRGPPFCRGHGHFSPVLAFLPERDPVLVGDVNRDFGPFPAPCEEFFGAVATLDKDSGRSRGLLVVRLAAEGPVTSPLSR